LFALYLHDFFQVMKSMLLVIFAQSAAAKRVSREDTSIEAETGCPVRVGGVDPSGSFSIFECRYNDAATDSYSESNRILGLITADDGARSTCAYECGSDEVLCYSQWLGPGNFVWKCGTGEDLPLSEQRNADDIVLRDIPASREELPPCPCTIYSGFCDRNDLHKDGEDWGVACVAAEDAFVTMHWMVQCVPIRAGGLSYHCPAHLPLMCDAERTQEPCDTSALGHCDAETCNAGHMLKETLMLPLFCQLGSCTQTECCGACPAGASSSGSSCTGPSGQSLPDSCCMEPEDGGEIVDTVSCPAQILALAEPTTMRMQAYMSTCMFSPADVDVSSPNFALTAAGAAKLCEGPCQAADVLTDAPLNIWADAQNVATTCDDPALTSQISPVGLFAAAKEMDEEWRACATGGHQGGGSSDGFINKDTPR